EQQRGRDVADEHLTLAREGGAAGASLVLRHDVEKVEKVLVEAVTADELERVAIYDLQGQHLGARALYRISDDVIEAPQIAPADAKVQRRFRQLAQALAVGNLPMAVLQRLFKRQDARLPFAGETLEPRNAVGREVPVGDLAHAAPKLKPSAHIGARIQDKAGAFDSLIIV